MADIKINLQSLINGITNDVKGRSLLDNSDSGDLAGQFSEVMMSRLADLGVNDRDIKAYLKRTERKDAPEPAAATDRKNDVKVETADQASPIEEKSAIKEKIQAYIKELSEKNDLPVEDTKALKALQKVAQFLVKASAEGKIALPPEMVEKLQQFLAKGDQLNAYDMSTFMHEFVDAFRDMKIALPSGNTDNADPLKWPTEIVQAFDDLGIKAVTGDETKPLNIVDILRSVKALVNESEKAANKTLDDKSKEAALPQDQSAALVVNNAAAAVAPAPAVAQASSVMAEEAIAPVTQKDIETSLSVDNNQIAEHVEQQQQAAATILPPLAAKAPKTAEPPKAQKAPDISAILASMTQTTEAAMDKQPSLTNLAMNAAYPSRSERKAAAEDGKTAAAATSPNATASADSAQLKSTATSSVAPAMVSSDVAAKMVDQGLDQITANNPVIGGIDGLQAVSAKNGLRAAQTGALNGSLAGAQAPASTVTQQVIAQISQKAGKATEISVQLTPAELGRVEVRLSIGRDGTTHTVVIAEKAETLALLQKDASQLERSLQDAGLSANSENMSFNLRDQQQAQQFGQSRKRFFRDRITDDKTAEITMNIPPEASIITDNRVNYHA